MTSTRKPKTAEEWAEYIARRREDVRALQADLKAGKGEVETARKYGFATRKDVEAHVARVIASR